MSLTKQFREYIYETGITVEKAAAMINTSRQYVNSVLTGRFPMSPRMAYKIGKFLEQNSIETIKDKPKGKIKSKVVAIKESEE